MCRANGYNINKNLSTGQPNTHNITLLKSVLKGSRIKRESS